MKIILALISVFFASSLYAECQLNHKIEVEVLSLAKKPVSANQQEWFFEAENAKKMQYRLEVKVYSSANHSSNPILIILPTIKSDTFIERNLARYFSKKGYTVFIPIIPDIEYRFDSATSCQLDQMYLRVQESMKILSLEIDKSMESSEKYLLGGSQGGIRSIIAAEVVSNVKAIWVNVAGGDFPSLYVDSEVDEIKDFRKKHMEYLALDRKKDYENFLRHHLLYDPINVCRKHSAPVSMVVALEDDSVPAKNQKLLVEACKPLKTRYLKTGHVRGVLDLIFNRKMILDFFEDVSKQITNERKSI